MHADGAWAGTAWHCPELSPMACSPRTRESSQPMEPSSPLPPPSSGFCLMIKVDCLSTSYHVSVWVQLTQCLTSISHVHDSSSILVHMRDSSSLPSMQTCVSRKCPHSRVFLATMPYQTPAHYKRVLRNSDPHLFCSPFHVIFLIRQLSFILHFYLAPFFFSFPPRVFL